MGGGAMHIDLPKIQFASSSSSSFLSVSSPSPNNLIVSAPSNYASSPKPKPKPKPSSSSSSSCQHEICKKLEAVDGKEKKRRSGSIDNFILGPVPSEPEVENALVALQNFVHGISSSRPEFKWMKSLSDSSGSRELLSQGLGRIYNGFIRLLTEPSIKRLVVSLASDKAVWDAINSNELVRKLCDLPQPAVENRRIGNSSAETDLGHDILEWILDIAKAKVAELVLNFQSLLNEVFQGGKRENADEESCGQVGEEIKSSLILSVVILLIVIVARVQRI